MDIVFNVMVLIGVFFGIPIGLYLGTKIIDGLEDRENRKRREQWYEKKRQLREKRESEVTK